VAPLEVEDALRDHPAILEVGVAGSPDMQWGEVVCAVVVARPGREGELHVDALREHCRDRLATYKHPRRLEVVDQLPHTPATGQIQRALIVERITSASR
jgi:acyl-CoA synthetase (AMP-forming)/AMP-acid ligase II